MEGRKILFLETSRKVQLILTTGIMTLILAGSGTAVGARPTFNSAGDERVRSCPKALTPGPLAAEGVLAAVRRHVPEVYRGNEYGTYRVTSLFSLAKRAFVPGQVAVYRGVAARAGGCGTTVARRSWAVLLEFPELAKVGTSLSQGVIFVAKTPRGWQVWYRYK